MYLVKLRCYGMIIRLSEKALVRTDKTWPVLPLSHPTAAYETRHSSTVSTRRLLIQVVIALRGKSTLFTVTEKVAKRAAVVSSYRVIHSL